MAQTSIESQEIQREFDWGDTSPSHAVLNLVSVLNGVDPIDLSDRMSGPLFDFIDPDALDNIIRSGSGLGISFAFDEYQVDISGNTLSVAPL